MKLFRWIADSGIWKSALYLFSISLIYFMIGLLSFTEGNLFDLSKLGDWDYWTVYLVTIGLAIAVLFLAMMNKKDNLKTKPKIEDEKAQIYALDKTIIDEGLTDKWKERIANLSKERKLAKYIRFLQREKAKATKQTVVDDYDNLIKEAKADKFDIETAVLAQKIKIRPLTTNTFVDGVEITDESDGYFYNGLENITQWILPMLIFGMILTMIILTLNQPTGREADIYTLVMLAMRLYIMTSYLVVGIRYGIYSINIVYYGVLVKRKNEYLKFFESNKMKVAIKDNESYKYKVDTEAGNG